MNLRDWISTLLVTFIILITVMRDVSAAEEKILVGFDGNAWKRVIVDVDLSRARFHKFLLLRGVLEGLVFGASPLMTDKSRPDSIYVKTTYNHLIDALDQFYSDYRNEEIFIVWALQVISMELRAIFNDMRPLVGYGLWYHTRKNSELEWWRRSSKGP